MATNSEKFSLFAERMSNAKIPQIVVDIFRYYYNQLVDGQTGFITESTIKPVNQVIDADSFTESLMQTGEDALPKTLVIKLNGGLGTSMGLEKAKSLLTVKQNLTFLDIIAQQVKFYGIPLVLMNSFATQADSLALLQKYPYLWGDMPLDFLQHKIPKITQTDFSPVDWPNNPDLTWCPPGHGDIYPALVTSGLLDRWLTAGYEYAFVSNADNLGAVMDKAILGYFAKNKLPFLMEVADRTEADKKGGHLAQRLHDGQLILRESAQCPPTDMASFQDISCHKYFNTNNLWLNLPALRDILQQKNNVLELPMICNSKTVDPTDSKSTPVYQLETAMGAAIAVFEGAQAVRVPRTRFAPVKTTSDLLAVWSDLYILTPDFRIVINPAHSGEFPQIDLDSRYYKLISNLETRFPYGSPSLLACQRLKIKGDFCFGRDVVLQGQVELINETPKQIVIPDGTLISGVNHYR